VAQSWDVVTQLAAVVAQPGDVVAHSARDVVALPRLCGGSVAKMWWLSRLNARVTQTATRSYVFDPGNPHSLLRVGRNHGCVS
jgi:hypothetical protein